MGKGAIGAGFARLLATVLVQGSGVLGRAFMQAYQQALKGGGPAAQQAAQAAKSRGGLLETEARQILNVKPKASEAEITEAYQKLTSMNDESKGGSKYINQKLTNAHNSLVDTAANDAKPEPPKEDGK